MKRAAWVSIAVLALASAARASTLDGTADFRVALQYMVENRYEESAEQFLIARENLPLLGDFALMYAARDFRMIDEDERAVHAAEELIANYPGSPLVKDARAVVIECTVSRDWERARALMLSYLADYPQDEAMRFRLASEMLSRGERESAIGILREIFVGAGGFAEDAEALAGPFDLVPGEMHRRGRNLLDRKLYAWAEGPLRESLAAEGSGGEARADLALVLFRQKKYSQAGTLFEEIGNLDLAAKSYLRAGMSEDFTRTLDAMLSAGDDAAATYMVAEADDLRRRGRTDEALARYREVMRIFPSQQELALWNIAWTQYLTGALEGANETFETLVALSPKPQYLYWSGRTVERMGGDATSLYLRIRDEDFYGFLARLRSGALPSGGLLVMRREPESAGAFERFDLLAGMGLRNEAAIELEHIVCQLLSYDQLVEAAYRFGEIGRFRQAISVLQRVPVAMQPDEVLYPLAFWPQISDQAQRNSLDPFLVLSVIREESRYDEDALSSAGARGLMQLMPTTAARMARAANVEPPGPDTLAQPSVNITLGTYYLGSLVRSFNSVSAALAAYNAGERRAEEWLARGYGSTDEFVEDIPYQETRNYIKRIMGTYLKYMKVRPSEPALAANIL